MEQKMEKLNRFFEEKITGCEQRAQELKADDRGDEAVFEKVRGNVYDVFRRVLGAALKTGKGDPEAVRRFYTDSLEKIPAGWKAAYENAVAHDDAKRAQTERIKLDAVAEIKEYAAQVWEGAE